MSEPRRESELHSEDAKLVTLARSTRGRLAAPEGAAVRDDTGRTYVGVTVDLASLRLTALEAAVATAATSGARSLEAAAIVTDTPGRPRTDLGPVRDLGGTGTPVHIARPDGTLDSTVTAG